MTSAALHQRICDSRNKPAIFGGIHVTTTPEKSVEESTHPPSPTCSAGTRKAGSPH